MALFKGQSMLVYKGPFERVLRPIAAVMQQDGAWRAGARPHMVPTVEG